MADEVITTGVDSLLELLKTVDKIALQDAAVKLNSNQGTIQSWVDFLVEEEIVGIEYKFTKPFIYLNKPAKSAEVQVEEENLSLEKYREEFNKRAAEKKIPDDKIEYFWGHHVNEILTAKKDFFYREARKRNLQNADILWKEYSNRMYQNG